MEEFIHDTRTNARIILTKIFDECHPADPLAPYQARVREWATTYLVMPHPKLGREGPVCPFTATAIHKRTCWLGCVDTPDLTADEITRIVTDVIPSFLRLPPSKEANPLLKTVLILFPAVTDYAIIDEAQCRLKEECVIAGLMIGQFYPGCQERGIRNPDFRPLQSPFALLAIRHMVSSDLPFLTAKPEWVEEHTKRFC